MIKRQFALLILILLSGFSMTADACTTAIISAKGSSNGKSMIWKLRDTSKNKNAIRYFDDGKYAYLGLVNSSDTLGEHVWGGSNSAGLAIMNSASYNVNINDTTQLKDQEGVFMKLVLQTCATLEDLEKLLDSYPKPRGQASNYGVIDANGSAAYYEVNNWTWTKFDANDESVAPNGYLIRSNYSDSGEKDEGYGYIRRESAEKVIAETFKNNKLNYKSIIQELSRCTYHAVFDINYKEKFENGTNESSFVASDDFITRDSSVSSIVVEGVKPGESPSLTTIWTQIGYPNTTIALPLWVAGGEKIPSVLAYDKEIKNSPLNKLALEWREKCYPLTRADGYHYLKLDELINQHNTGLMQRIEPVEKKIFDKTDNLLAKWANKTPDTSEISSLYNWLDNIVIEFYNNAKSDL